MQHGGPRRTSGQGAVGDAVSEQTLLGRVLSGERGAWNDFVREFEGFITACVLRVLRRYHVRLTVEDQHDLVSEVWLALLRDDCAKLRRFDPERGCRLRSWIGMIAANTTIDYLRVRYTADSYLEDAPQLHLMLVERSGPDMALQQAQQAEMARWAIGRLRREEQAFVRYCFHDEQEPAEIARRLGISVNTVHSRKFKLRCKLTRIVSQLERAAA